MPIAEYRTSQIGLEFPAYRVGSGLGPHLWRDFRMAQFSIPCELTITPGNGSAMQNKFRLSANGETIFDDYQSGLTDEQIALCKQIAEAHSRLLSKFANQ